MIILPETNVAPENWWLEDVFPIEIVPFQVRTISFREGRTHQIWPFFSSKTKWNDLFSTIHKMCPIWSKPKSSSPEFLGFKPVTPRKINESNLERMVWFRFPLQGGPYSQVPAVNLPGCTFKESTKSSKILLMEEILHHLGCIKPCK